MASSPPNLNSQENKEDHTLNSHLARLSLSSKTVHADDYLNKGRDVAPPMHVSTTFRFNQDPELLVPSTDLDAPYDGFIYSRHSTPNTTRFEAILSNILGGPTLTYASGLAAFHALLVFLNPGSISVGQAYHGCHDVIFVHQKLTGLKKLSLDCDPDELQPGDVVHIETPVNPNGTATNLALFAEKAHKRGAYLTVDATFAPPPLQDPFAWGADVVVHSGTKYIGGHSDMLCGILAINPARAKEGWFEKMLHERMILGGVMGNFEGWLGIRSIRTLEIRVERQSSSATKLVSWLNAALNPKQIEESGEVGRVVQKVVEKIDHASLQEADIADGWLLKQMPNGFGAVFSITLREQSEAKRLPSKLHLFHHATSLGGVESLIEWRTMSDAHVDRRLLRISVGIEGWEDLRDDLLQGFKTLLSEREAVQ